VLTRNVVHVQQWCNECTDNKADDDDDTTTTELLKALSKRTTACRVAGNTV